ncbi:MULTISPECIES: STAS domain-containing protein [Microbacterium]|jgi:anti-sigma B factor antagonist|uniref:STAS domain-containing protein n=1 Tax=Microbacterium TaxID=33882 RepID=UPI001D177EE1|nr:STAS domain-containing protein [Microbacterium testaceum]MCC4249394.1 STAS domain-containing protein [Microbacterium testaceum]
MLKVDIDARDGATVVIPHGRLTMVSARDFRETVGEVIARGTSPIVVIDLSQTEFVDSSGIGALVSCLSSARQSGGDLRLAAPTDQVTMVLELTNLDRVLRPRASVEEALRD